MMGVNDKLRAIFGDQPEDTPPWMRTISKKPHPIEKLTAPPETVRGHLDRIGVSYIEGRSVIVILKSELDQAENPQEDQDGKQ